MWKNFKRYDPTRDPAAVDFIPVARAAGDLHDRLYPGCGVKEAQTLDTLAATLAQALPIYQRDADTGALRKIDPAVLARGRFTRGATRLEFGDGTPLRFLLVSRKELEPVMDEIAADPARRGLQQAAGDAARAA